MADMFIKCNRCGYKETLNKRFILKAMGGVFAGGGFWAWVTYFFAGTGFALPICIALVTGGIAIAAFSDDIAKWVSSKYDCPKCKKRSWRVVEE